MIFGGLHEKNTSQGLFVCFLFQIDIEVIAWQGLFDVNPHFAHRANQTIKWQSILLSITMSISVNLSLPVIYIFIAFCFFY